MSKYLQFGIGTSILLIPALLLSKRLTFCKADRKSGPRIAIVGGGIGGSSAAYFARQVFGSSSSIDVFEKTNRVGGRLATVEIGGHWYEAGGSIIHPANKYMDSFVKDLGEITVRWLGGGGGFFFTGILVQLPKSNLFFTFPLHNNTSIILLALLEILCRLKVFFKKWSRNLQNFEFWSLKVDSLDTSGTEGIFGF